MSKIQFNLDKLKCSDCQEYKTPDNFAKAKGPRGYYYYCKPCHRVRRQKEYQKNKGKIAADRKGRKREVLSVLGTKCSRCGWDEFPDVLEFHHLDPSQKEYGLHYLITWDVGRAIAEAKKCIVLCANCHSALHSGLWLLNHKGKTYKYSKRSYQILDHAE